MSIIENLSAIVAVCENWGIGKNNDMLFYLSEDLKRFKKITTGKSIIMGRKTFDSLPNGALPNRRNIVISSQKNLILENAEVVESIEKALSLTKDDNEVFCIGGGSIYKAVLPYCKKLYLTKVDKDFDADVFFPKVDLCNWDLVSQRDYYSEKFDFNYHFIDLIRK